MSVYTSKKFWLDAAERAIKTLAQTMVAMLGAGATGLLDVDWVGFLSVSGLAAFVSLLTSIASASVVDNPTASLVVDTQLKREKE
jgi:Putative lactococcus lactis phage r1t holin